MRLRPRRAIAPPKRSRRVAAARRGPRGGAHEPHQQRTGRVRHIEVGVLGQAQGQACGAAADEPLRGRGQPGQGRGGPQGGGADEVVLVLGRHVAEGHARRVRQLQRATRAADGTGR